MNTIKYLVFTFSILIMGTTACKDKEELAPPNIIFLLADDHRADALGAAGNGIIQTPNLDKLAEDGMMFSNAFVTTSICACSRASIMTGQYISRNGIVGFKEDFTQEQFDQTYPQQLRRNGYQVGFVGKYGIGKGNLKREKKAFDYFWGQNGQPRYENIDANGDTIHYTRLIKSKIFDFLGQVDKAKPFCLSVSFKAPHVQDRDPRQFIPQKKFSELYKDDIIPVPDVNNENYEERFPAYFRMSADGKQNEARRRWDIRFSTPEKHQESVKQYYRLISGIDEVVGELREELKMQGLNENTVIIYMGDNGFYLGEHGLAGKWYGHEPSIKVPMLMYNPTAKRKSKENASDKIVLNIDIAPTILSLAGIEDEGAMQGDALTKIYASESRTWRKAFYYEHLLEASIIPRSQGIRNESFKYLYYPDSPDGYEELYDLQQDPDERTNLASDSNKKELLTAMRTQFLSMQQNVK